jgi:hypothetical protein
MAMALSRGVALGVGPAAFGCDSDDEPFNDSNSGRTGGNGGTTGGQSGMRGEGGSSTADMLEDPLGLGAGFRPRGPTCRSHVTPGRLSVSPKKLGFPRSWT